MPLPVAWKEGMFLSPQHLQCSDQFHNEVARELLGCPQGLHWGLSRLEIQEDLLSSSVFNLLACEGFFPDGTYFRLEPDQGGLSRNFGELFSSDKASLGVSLAMRTPQPGAPGLSADGANTPFREYRVSIADQNSGLGSREICLAQPSLHLLFEGENPAGFQLLPLARLKPNRQGLPAVDPENIPPSISVHGAPSLLTALRRLLDTLKQKRNGIAAANPSASSANMQPILYLQSLQRSIPVLEHLLGLPGSHPAEIYRELLRLAGDLQFMQAAQAINPYPKYEHHEPSASFIALLRRLLELVNANARSDFHQIRLTNETPTVFTGNLTELGGEAYGTFYLAVESALPTEQIVMAFPQNSKISSRSKLQAIVMSALKGIEVKPLASPPAFLQSKPGYTYYRLVPEGNLWSDLMQEKALAMNTPAALQVKSVDFIAAKE